MLVVAVLAGLAGGRLSGGSGTVDQPSPPDTAPSDTASDQARQVKLLLDQSIRDRRLVSNAIDLIEKCQMSAIEDLKKALDGRARGLEQAERLRVDKLPRGAELQANLKDTMRLSRDANNARLQWAEAYDCGSPNRCNKACERHRGTADRQAHSAEEAKKQVVQLWNRIAPHYGNKTFSEDDI
jgi:hypothetical protein